MTQRVHLEAEEPALRGLPEARAVFPHQAHPLMSEVMAQRNRLGINQIKSRTGRWHLGAGAKQSAALGAQALQTSHPLRIGTQVRKSRAAVVGHQAVGLFEARHPETAWQQGDSQHFRIGKQRSAMR